MTARSLLGVILSDERSEESKDPFGAKQSQTCCCTASTRWFLAAIGFLRLRARPTRTITPTSAKAALAGDPENSGSGNFCGRSAQG